MPDLNVNLPVVVVETANLRAEPGRNAPLLQILPAGHNAMITGGPMVADELTWWQLDAGGWCVERIGDEDVLEVAPATEWERAIYFVLRQEGGLSVDAHDAGNWTGGAVGSGTLKGTKYGLSSLAFPDIDIANLTKAEAKEIYWHSYWTSAGCDALPWPLSFAHFDASVNCGIGQASRFLNACNGDFATYNQLRREFYQTLNQFNLYGHGWMRRVDELEQEANQ